MGRLPTEYATIWTKTEQPTTILTGITNNTFGNLVKFNHAGKLVGMRWGRTNNVTDAGALALVFAASSPHIILRCARFAARTSVAGLSVVWTNTYFHPQLVVAANDVLMLCIATLLAPMNYNDAALLAADVTIGDFTYPKEATPAHNGATGATLGLYPNTAANGRRYSLDVLFLRT
jgi:hypothetical protein